MAQDAHAERGEVVTNRLSEWNVSDHLKTAEAQVLYLDACLDESGEDSALMIAVLRDIAHAQGIDDLAVVAGLDPDSLSDGCELSLETFLKAAHSLGIRIHAGDG
jgi:probable addiction module antidote protein